MIDEIERIPTRGSIKHVYRLRSIVELRKEVDTPSLTGDQRAEDFLLSFLTGVVGDTKAPRSQTSLRSDPLDVDAEGWREAKALFDKASCRLREISEWSKARRGTREAGDSWAIALALLEWGRDE
ncbi:MAG: hypothetical protein ABW065_03755 [Solirubrobacterales bacterium]